MPEQRPLSRILAKGRAIHKPGGQASPLPQPMRSGHRHAGTERLRQYYTGALLEHAPRRQEKGFPGEVRKGRMGDALWSRTMYSI
jgi:hypothetical protein